MDISGFSSNLIIPSKSLKEIVSEIFNGHKISHDVENILDVQKKEFAENKFILIVTFKSYEEKMRIMKLKRDFHKKKKFSIRFNHTLTSTNRLLFMQAKNLCINLKHLRVYITHGRIFMNKLNVTQGVEIKSVEDLKIIEENGGLDEATGPSTSKRTENF